MSDDDLESRVPAPRVSSTSFDGDLNSDRIVLQLLFDKLREVERVTGRFDVLTFIGPLTQFADVSIRRAVERLDGRNKSLLFLIETEGGYIEVVERIVNTLRHFYKRVDFLVPDHAMSAGTVLVMSGDSILMDYFSTLGPIDPQVQRRSTEGMMPVQGYLARYRKLLEKERAGEISTAELNILLSRFDQAEIYKFEQAVELSVTLLKTWLVKYKFKDWKTTEDQGRRVTKAMKVERAVEIARALNDPTRWHTHARGISMETLRRDLNLEIDDFGENDELSGAVKSYI